MSADLDDVDLAVAARLFPPFAVAPQAGRGDVAVWFEWQEGVLMGGTADIALADVTLQSPLGAVDSRFEQIALSGNWERTSESWRFALRDVAVTRAAAPGPKGPPSTSTSGAMPTASNSSRCAAASCASKI